MIELTCAWYRDHKRDLPWRHTRDPYRIWVSEIMLQQTRVEAARPYYERFLEALPNVEALAACPEDRLLKLWEGLGYYSRARNMKKAAQLLAESDGFPRTAAALRELPGIGPYTAGAIASMAFDEPVPAADGNVFRILSRLRADDREIDRADVRREMTEDLAKTMREFFYNNKEHRPGDLNQGLMDLGAGVCLPNAEPRCGECPLAKRCAAHAAGRETAYPVRAAKKARRVEKKTVLLIRDGERVVLAKRPETGLLAGMYEFPCLPQGIRPTRKAITTFVEESGLTPLRVQRLEDARHVFTHIEWHMTGYEVRVASLEQEPAKGWILAEIEEIERDFPIPSAYRAYAKVFGIEQAGGHYESRNRV